MSSCPTKDIHSVYLDGELPMAYLAEYESHIKSCPKCAATLNRMRALSAAFKADGDAIAKDDVFMAQSYERLMNRMRYSRVTKKAQRLTFKPVYFVPMAAAAALLVAVIVPLSLRGRNVPAQETAAHTAKITPITRRQNISMEQRNVVINGTISPSAISSNIPLNVSNGANAPRGTNVSSGNASSMFIAPQPNQAENDSNVFTDFDMFAPQIDSKQQLVLKVTPHISDGQQGWTLTLTTGSDIEQ